MEGDIDHGEILAGKEPFSEGFAIKNVGFEHAAVFVTMMFDMLMPYIANKTPFRTVIEYDPEQDCNAHVHIEGIKDGNTERLGSIHG